MKKIIAALTVMSCLCIGCNKPNPNPPTNSKKKLAKIYTQASGSEKKLHETWSWNGEKLSEIVTTWVNDRQVTTFEYNGNQVSKITYCYSFQYENEPPNEYIDFCVFTYEGSKYKNIEVYSIEDGEDYLSGIISIEYSGNKISKMYFTETEYLTKSKRANSFSKLLRFVIPETTCRTLEQNIEKSFETKSEHMDSVNFIWEGDNVVKEIWETAYYSDTISYTYDNKKNPYYGILLNQDSDEFSIGFSKNNIVKIVYDDDSSLFDTYEYVYEGDYPIQKISRHDANHADIIYYEYE